MDITYVEHQTAPRLEKDVHDFFTQARFGVSNPKISDDKNVKNQKQEWSQVFLDYFDEWNFLMFSHRDSEFSFWITQFRSAYFSVLSRIDPHQHYFVPNTTHTAKWLIEQILEKLKALFKTTGFTENLHQCNDQYEKHIRQLQDTYTAITKISVNAPDLKFYLSYLSGTEQLQAIDQVIQSFRAFEKKLKCQPWFRSQVILTYYHLIRDSYKNCYVIRFYLTFQNVFYSTDTNYSALIQRLWLDATNQLGTLLIVDEEMSKQPLGNPFCLGRDEIMEFPEPKDPLDDLAELPESVTCVTEKMNKICIMTRGFKVFNAKKIL
ncbi:hypothetical protein [Acinetobacter beijerinckii]|uniref:hypothetical protein n=1 Tax=Acinetobacter beijerinckii TaxID=262668 RepID=UPI00300A7369